MERIVYVQEDRFDLPEDLLKLSHEQIRDRIRKERQKELEKKIGKTWKSESLSDYGKKPQDREICSVVFLCKNGRRADHIWEKVKEGGGNDFVRNQINKI